ncbi:unnamed protein product [Rotaria sp. Silwood2]|nr:unnamed protein product [Rotaria sp. Silwood2]CAF3147487.1 unnamed protein product [Rotaria sp. Silwood2]CAF4413510.1 unnamed protein product [Rotaria sp. Silwood2]CAF4568105.1 unnamed protein product [Rotaria sp. Silwood2]
MRALNVNLFQLSDDLVIYMCDMIASNLFSFLAIDDDIVSNTISEIHTRFVVSLLLTSDNLLNYNNEIRQVAITALINLFEVSNKNEIRQAVAYALGYVCDELTYKSLFEKIIFVMSSVCDETSAYSNNILSVLISSYCHCVSINKVAFDQDDLNLFCILLRHDSQDISKAACTELGRVFQDTPFLLGMLGLDYVQCYHTLIGSTAFLYLYDVQQNRKNAIAKFIEEQPTLLSIFLVESYNSIRGFPNRALQMADIDLYLAYEYPPYMNIVNLIAIRMPTVFCAFIKDWCDGDNLKRALFYASK